MDRVQKSKDTRALFSSSFSRRRALRLLGTGLLVGVPFASFAGTASAERLPAAAAPTPAAPPRAAPTPAASAAPEALPARFATVADVPLWADTGGSLPLGDSPT